MNFKTVFLAFLIIAMLLTGCQKAQPDQSGSDTANAAPASSDTNNNPGTPGDRPAQSLDGVNRLAFGTLKLEGSENAVTPEQAGDMLPLWQMIQGGTLQNDAETAAVVKQIEAQMNEAQLAAITDMSLTMEDMQTWMQEQGLEMPGPMGGQGAPGDGQGMTDEERTQMREQFENMTEEERATAMAERGFERPEGGGPPGGGEGDFQPPQGDAPTGQGPGGGMRGGSNVFLEPLITLLTERAAE